MTIASALGILLDGQTSIGDSRIPWAPEAGTKKGDGETGMGSIASCRSLAAFTGQRSYFHFRRVESAIDFRYAAHPNI